MKTVKALSKQLFGARYERFLRSILICTIVYIALCAAEIKFVIAPFILFLTASFFTAGVMLQALGSNHNSEIMMGMFMLPFESRHFTIVYVLVFSAYTMITKASLALVSFFAVGQWDTLELLISAVCAANGCFMAAAWYIMLRKKRTPWAVLWAAGAALSVFFTQELILLLCITGISLCCAFLYILSSDAYHFCRTVSVGTVLICCGKKGSVLVYLLRYLLMNKAYLVNTAGLCGIACLLPILLGGIGGLNTMPLGFAILCLNTPVCTLLSCDRDLEQAVRVLPGQTIQFCFKYCRFLIVINISVSAVYLFSWNVQYGGVSGTEILTAIIFAVQSAVLSVLLEWMYPIRSWRIESDLWHHPRKYIVPLAMIFLAVLVGAWEPAVWAWLCILTAECAGLWIKSKGF